MNVRGLTTAATVWCSAAVGSVAAGDMLAAAALPTGCVILINTLLRPLVGAINRIRSPAAASRPTYGVTVTT